MYFIAKGSHSLMMFTKQLKTLSSLIPNITTTENNNQNEIKAEKQELGELVDLPIKALH